jgi:GT2 family glycosyltransferase
MWLARCLKALRQLDHAAFEIVIVADTGSLRLLEGDDFKRRTFDAANISQARNIGIAAASGDICAFVDDDAVPEPMWLRHLEEAFIKTKAGAIVGYVRGRNGISFQSRVDSVDVEGETHQENAPDDVAFVPELPNGHALKLVGTNAAFRRDVLFDVNGFDPAYVFFLDDTDISLRLANAGIKTAVAPLAEVHHAFAPSKRRTALRAPKHLADIGRSTAIFLRRHRGIPEHELFKRVYDRERKRLIRHMVQGTCEPKDVGKNLRGLRDGWKDGLSCDLPSPPQLKSEESPFCGVTPMSEHIVLTSRLLRRHVRVAEAAKLADSGQRVSVFSFSLTPVRHLVRYSDSGVWVQTGGQFGRTYRSDRVFRWCRFAKREKLEILRVAKQRGI